MSGTRESLETQLHRLREMKLTADRSESDFDRRELADEIAMLEAQLAGLQEDGTLVQASSASELPPFEVRKIPKKAPRDYIDEALKRLRE